MVCLFEHFREQTAGLKSKIVLLLDGLTEASLKPQQRLFILKVFLLSKMVLGRDTFSTLNEIDKMVGGFVRQRLALCSVIDAHIVGDNVDMMATREAKIQKYPDNPGIDAAIKSKPWLVEVRHCSLIITSSRGIWCHKSAEDLIGRGVLSRKDILLMSVIQGRLKEF